MPTAHAHAYTYYFFVVLCFLLYYQRASPYWITMSLSFFHYCIIYFCLVVRRYCRTRFLIEKIIYNITRNVLILCLTFSFTTRLRLVAAVVGQSNADSTTGTGA